MKTLILFHSKYGQTRKIAQRIGQTILDRATQTNSNVWLDMIEINDLPDEFSLDNFDVVILGSPIYTGRHSGALANFIKSHRVQLKDMQTGFFSVSLSASGDEKQKSDARNCMDRFLARCEWQPSIKTIFGGELAYRKYGWFTRWMMKRIVRRAGGDLDTTQNYEYTRWEDVVEFAEHFCEPFVSVTFPLPAAEQTA